MVGGIVEPEHPAYWLNLKRSRDWVRVVFPVDELGEWTRETHWPHLSAWLERLHLWDRFGQVARWLASVWPREQMPVTAIDHLEGELGRHVEDEDLEAFVLSVKCYLVTVYETWARCPSMIKEPHNYISRSEWPMYGGTDPYELKAKLAQQHNDQAEASVARYGERLQKRAGYRWIGKLQDREDRRASRSLFANRKDLFEAVFDARSREEILADDSSGAAGSNAGNGGSRITPEPAAEASEGWTPDECEAVVRHLAELAEAEAQPEVAEVLTDIAAEIWCDGAEPSAGVVAARVPHVIRPDRIRAGPRRK